jgi:hypothetical protein
VSVRNLDTNVARTTTTAVDGRYIFPGLFVGRYEVTVNVTGFAKHVRGPINLALNQQAIVNTEIQPALVQETMVVAEDAPMLNTTTTEVGVRFEERRLADLPISGQFGSGGGFRDVFASVLSAPGVSQLNSGNSELAAGTSFSSNGVRTRGNNFMIDGQDSNDQSTAGRTQWLNNPDVVKEVRLITNQFLAEYGRSAGSVVNAITKSGTNSFHGSAFEFFSGSRLITLSNLDKAAGYKEVPFLVEHQFGGTGGGRIIKDKTFLFGSLQRWTIRQLGSGVTIRGVPTDQGRQIIQQMAGSRPSRGASQVPARCTSGDWAERSLDGRRPDLAGPAGFAHELGVPVHQQLAMVRPHRSPVEPKARHGRALSVQRQRQHRRWAGHSGGTHDRGSDTHAGVVDLAHQQRDTAYPQ